MNIVCNVVCEPNLPVEEYCTGVQLFSDLEECFFRFWVLRRVGPNRCCETIRRIVHEVDDLFIRGYLFRH